MFPFDTLSRLHKLNDSIYDNNDAFSVLTKKNIDLHIILVIEGHKCHKIHVVYKESHNHRSNNHCNPYWLAIPTFCNTTIIHQSYKLEQSAAKFQDLEKMSIHIVRHITFDISL